MEEFEACIQIVYSYKIRIAAESWGEAQYTAEQMSPEEIQGRGTLDKTYVVDLGKM